MSILAWIVVGLIAGAIAKMLMPGNDPGGIVLTILLGIAGAIVASQTDGVVTLPANLADSIAGPLGLVAFKPPIALPRIEIAQYWHERYHRDPAHRWIRTRTFELFGK